MWDCLAAAGTLILLPALVPLLLNSKAYVPRLASGLTALGIAMIAAALFGAGLTLTALVDVGSTVGWVGVFVLRGRKQ